MTRLAAALLTVSIGALPGARGNQETPQPPTFKAGVDLVSVSVVVKNHKGRPVTGLSRKDFELFDSGRMRDIADFRSEASAVSVAMLLDTSGSMRISGKWDAAREAVAKLAAELERGRDHIALFTSDTERHVAQPFTTSPTGAVDAPTTAQPSASPAMFHAASDSRTRPA